MNLPYCGLSSLESELNFFALGYVGMHVNILEACERICVCSWWMKAVWPYDIMFQQFSLCFNDVAL